MAATGAAVVSESEFELILSPQRKQGSNVMRLSASLMSATLVFVLTYLAAWFDHGASITLGPTILHGKWDDFRDLRRAIADFTEKNGKIPDSLDELPQNPRGYNPLDLWGHPYQYGKTEKGYRIFSLGRDGLPGGRGLDADIEPDEYGWFNIRPSLMEMLTSSDEAAQGLHEIALAAAVCTGVICFIAPWPKGRESYLVPGRRGRTIAILLASLFLCYLAIESARFCVGFMLTALSWP